MLQGGTFTNLGRPFGTKQFSFLNGQRKGTWAVMLGAKAAGSGDVGYGTKGPRNILRPLSPHLTIYEPQRSSTSSISNRIAGVFLTAVVLSFYLVFMKMGPICLTYGNFYQFLFYASSTKLMLITAEVSALALLYHIYQSVRHHLLWGYIRTDGSIPWMTISWKRLMILLLFVPFLVSDWKIFSGE